MNEWLLRQGVDTPQLGLLLGVLAGLLLAVVFSWWASRRSARAAEARAEIEIGDLQIGTQLDVAAVGIAFLGDLLVHPLVQQFRRDFLVELVVEPADQPAHFMPACGVPGKQGRVREAFLDILANRATLAQRQAILVGINPPGLVHRLRVVGAHRRPGCPERLHQHATRRLAHVVGARLEREAQECKGLALQIAVVVLADLLEESMLLADVDVLDRIQQRRLVAGLLRRLGESAYVLREA